MRQQGWTGLSVTVVLARPLLATLGVVLVLRKADVLEHRSSDELILAHGLPDIVAFVLFADNSVLL